MSGERGEVRLSWDVRREGGVIFYFLRGGGADPFWNDPMPQNATVAQNATVPQNANVTVTQNATEPQNATECYSGTVVGQVHRVWAEFIGCRSSS